MTAVILLGRVSSGAAGEPGQRDKILCYQKKCVLYSFFGEGGRLCKVREVSAKNPTTPSCYLRIKKGTKILCLIEGERLDYEAYGMSKMTDPSIPQKPRLKMKRSAEEKVVYFTVETGRGSRFPYLWLRFKLDYEE